jgi:hypothetical protein
MTKARIEKSDLPRIIENIEKHGGDASELRAMLETSGKPTASQMSDEDFVAEKIKEAEITEGDTTCPICNKPAKRLVSGVCDDCFHPWALTTKKE